MRTLREKQAVKIHTMSKMSGKTDRSMSEILYYIYTATFTAS